MTHSELVHIAYRWLLRQGVAVAFKELVSMAMEQPDVIGFGGPVSSVLIEVKVSRADFKADSKKFWRIYPAQGMGSHRIYCAPEGLLKLEELPAGWALLSVAPTGKATLTHRPHPDYPTARFLANGGCHAQPCNEQNEAKVMLSALRRLQQLGVVDQIHRQQTPELV